MEQNVFDTIIIGGGAGGLHRRPVRRPGRLFRPGAGETLPRRADGHHRPDRQLPGLPPGGQRLRAGAGDAERGPALRRPDGTGRSPPSGPAEPDERKWSPRRRPTAPPPWCWPPGPAPGSWACPASGSCGAGGCPTAPPATACSTGARPWRWWGGGNTAAADVLYLSRLCEKVYLIHRRDQLRASRVYLEPLKQAENVEILWDSQVTELLYGETLTGAKVAT